MSGSHGKVGEFDHDCRVATLKDDADGFKQCVTMGEDCVMMSEDVNVIM